MVGAMPRSTAPKHPHPSEPAAPPPRAVELWVALAVLGLGIVTLLWKPIFTEQIYLPLTNLQGSYPWRNELPYVEPTPGGPWGGGEVIRNFFPYLKFSADCLRQGLFPLWNPHANAGAPLLGNQLSAVFSMLQIPFYIVPIHAMRFLEDILKLALAFWGAFFFARTVGMALVPGLFAGMAYAFCPYIVGHLVYQQATSATWHPWVFLGAEAFIRKQKPGLYFLPFAVGFASMAGHAETALFTYIACGVYTAFRLRQTQPQQKWVAPFIRFSAFSGLGGFIAAPYLIPCFEYYWSSYNKAWRESPGLLSLMDSMSRPLGSGDVPQIAVLLGGVFAAVWSTDQIRKGRLWGWVTAVSAAGVSLGAAMNLGLENYFPFSFIGFQHMGGFQMSGALLTLCALYGLIQKNQPVWLKALGWPTLLTIAVAYRAPFISQLFYYSPFFKLSHFHFLEHTAAFGMACYAAWGAQQSLTSANRLDDGKRLIRLVLALAGTWIIGIYTQGPLMQSFGSEPVRLMKDSFHTGEGFETPGKTKSWKRWIDIGGSFPQHQGIQSAQIGLLINNQFKELPGITLRHIGDRATFKTRIQDSGLEGEFFPVALVMYNDGRQEQYAGLPLSFASREPFLKANAVALVGLLLMIFFFAWPARIAWTPIAAVAILEIIAHGWGWVGAAPKSLYYPTTPAIEFVKKGPWPPRVFGPADNLLWPDTSTWYRFYDYRGADDVTTLHKTNFDRLAIPFLYDSDPKRKTIGLQLMGLASVGYLLEASSKNVSPLLGAPVYQGGLTIYSNPFAKPYLQLFPPSAVRVRLDEGVLEKYREAEPLISDVAQKMLSGELDPGTHLLLHQRPMLQGMDHVVASYEAPSMDVLVKKPTELTLKTVTTSAQFLMESEVDFPGWKAYVDGKETPLLRAWLAFRAIELPAGEHVVRFLYRPANFYIAVLSCLIVMLVLLSNAVRSWSSVSEWSRYFERGMIIFVFLQGFFWLGWAAIVAKTALPWRLVWLSGLAALAYLFIFLLTKKWRSWRDSNP